VTVHRSIYEPEHRDFGESFRRWLAAEVLPNFDGWERDGIVPREVFREAGRQGFLAFELPEDYGGAGVSDFRFNAVLGEEGYRAGVAGFAGGLTLHNDICLPYFLRYCTDEQRERWFPGIVSGELITAVAMTEPGTGSDLAGIATRAVRSNGGYVVNGAKTFITNGINADLVITAVRTNPDERHRGLSLVVIERGMDGFERGRNLDKIGLHSADTAEMSFEDVHVPAENLLGEEGLGFRYLTSNLPQERMSIAIGAVAAAAAALETTVEYVKSRKAFGQPIGAFQNTRFVLAELKTELALAQTFVDRCTALLSEEALPPEDAAMAKWWCTELQGRVVDRCVQLHGGYGYMTEYPIARAYQDARITRIYGGTTEIMKEIIGRSMGL
jgi:alkylation response protein AidB-like acyl-CoA dehydrogenase